MMVENRYKLANHSTLLKKIDELESQIEAARHVLDRNPCFDEKCTLCSTHTKLLEALNRP